ncbi:E3 ubiquitin-protein ligase RNF31-like isoform X2 [Melanotaenia boesemani]|uniref:E3 ubiquitin-protein ligase RNF31-like isoform X2 n=2 Tax=Melanotaenia boesemani TaxID=1250792 RepID=UPI001C04E4F0|nr:E3 ubiquitin-protein ligase RNF31-like isoform X2 [Melanotaenia boesemani]
MARVGEDAELRTLTECRYRYPGETLQDLQTARSLFSDLRLYVDFYCFPNKEKRKLLFLAGTLPVLYEGSRYNMPVCIWLHETHPASRPRCYVCPSVSMVINPSCPWVDSSGNISLDGLSNWTHGVSSLSVLLSEMTQAFQKDTPLYARCPLQAPPSTGVPGSVGSIQKPSSFPPSSSAQSHLLSPVSCYLSGPKGKLPVWIEASQWKQSRQVRVRTSYTEELLGIDFSPHPPSFSGNPFLSSSYNTSDVPITDPISQMMVVLKLDGEFSGDQPGNSPVRSLQSQATQSRNTTDVGPQPNLCSQKPLSGPAHGAHLSKIAARLPRDQAAVFLALMTMEGRSFNTTDVIEAVQLNRDLKSALRFLTHTCPICHDQVSFSKIITMTHCSCFLCQTCFTGFFSVAIRERSIDQLVCPQCGQPEVRGQEGLEQSMDYFSLLDTQIRHFLPAQIHELFQRKLRDQALRGMPNFCWCAHCSFGMLHEVDRLRMDCPSCKKSTCSQCRSPWVPQHQGLSCEQFRVWQQQNQPSSPLLNNSIACPQCQCVFGVSKGGCLHFTCSQCGHQFCGGCSRHFALGSACNFSAECGTKGLHAHHPRDCLYHLRDWTVTRLHLLLQHYRVSPSWMEPANGSSADTSQTAACPVLELRDGSSGEEEPCGRPVLPEYRGYCQLHYKECLVELINRCRADPVVLFSPAEMEAELQRWHITVPNRKPDEPEPLYAHRLRLMVTNSIPLEKQRSSPVKLDDDL